MARRLSLRSRLALAFASFCALIAALLALAVAYGAHDVARRLMDQTLAAEIEDYIARHERNPASLPPAAAGLRGYVAPLGGTDFLLPESVRSLPSGRHELVIDGIPYRAAVEEREGWRYVVLFDETRQKRREARFIAWLMGGTLVAIAGAFLGAWWVAGQALAPLSHLAAAIEHANAENPPRLSQPDAPDDELAQLAAAFDRYLARIGEFIARERDFTADASHELRTPLAVIQGAAELLVGDMTLTPTARERAVRIERAARRMGELIEALLLLAREQSVTGQCDAGRLIRETMERFASPCRSRAIESTLEAPATLTLSLPAPLFVVLSSNLLRNACAHARRRVRIELTPAYLRVLDDGPGMDAQALASACQRHWRGPDSSGAGIGLALVARICELAGFSLHLDNRPEGGFIAQVEFSKHKDDALS